MANNINFILNASSAGVGAVHRTEGRDLIVAQLLGSFTSVRVALEGRTVEGEGTWERIGVFKVTKPDTTLPVMSGSGIYECPIFGLAEIRFNVLSIADGSVSVAGVFYDTATDNFYPYEIERENMTQMGGSNLFVKGVAEQIFMDPTTGNIVGYDRTATNASVATQVNLQEVVGGMGNRLVGVLPDTVRINGTYESVAFSLETREKIMGGQIAYDAVASVCEKITADDSGELTVSQKPAPFYGEDSLPDVKVPIYANITDTPIADFFVAEEVVGMETLVVGVECTQTGTGDPAPDNERPISGWTGAKIVRCGSNLAELHNGTNPDASKYTYSHLDGGNITCIKNTDVNGFFAKFMFRAVKGTTYRFAFDSFMANGVAKSLPVYIYKNELRGEVITNFTFSSTMEWTATESGLLVVGLYGLGVWESGTQITINGFRIGLAAESDKGYAGYEGNTYSVTFPAEAGTVYGGTLDLTAGTLTVDRAARTLGSMSWIATSTQHRFNSQTLKNTVKAPGSNSEVADGLICSTYKAISSDAAGSGASGSGVSVSVAEIVSVRDENYTDVDTWIAAMGDKMLVYPLATPVVYQLTPVQIEALVGENVVSADCGNIQTLKCRVRWETIEADGNVYRAYVRESGVGQYSGTAYGVDAKTRKVIGFVPEEDKTYEVTYYTHNASASMLPIPTMWNPVIMTVQVKYGVYAKQGVGDKENRGVLKGWLYFIVPRAMLTADAGANASQTGTATTDGSWMALTNKAENLPMCADCDGSSDPMAYYVYVPCGDMNESVVAILSVGGGMVLSPGQKKQLPIKLLMPDDTLAQPDFTTLNYLSDDENVATVTPNGEAVGVAVGSTIINASLALADGTVLSCKTMVVVA